MASTRPATRLDEARERLAETVLQMNEWDEKAQSLPDDADEREIEFISKSFADAQRKNQRWQETVDRLAAIEEAREQADKRISDGEDTGERSYGAAPMNILSVREERTYSEASAKRGVSFFTDLINSIRGDGEARERLDRHTREVAVENRDMSTTVTAGGNFVPPAYLGELYADLPRAGRPFANAIGARPLMASGMNITIPRITTGTEVDVQDTENTAIANQDAVEALLTVPVRTIAGYVDVSQQLFDRSEPGIDAVLFQDLRSDYDTTLDAQLLNGSGSAGQHRGIRSVASINTVTYTDSSPTGAEHVPPIYDAISQVETARHMPADLIVMHPRRAAFLASSLSSTFPLFQQGTFMQAVGSQDGGMTLTMAGLTVVKDGNVRTTDGASTNQDEIYVLRSSDLILWEGPLQARVLTEVGADQLTVRLQLFAYSAFAGGRYPQSISVIAGTGLTAPDFS